MMKYDWLLNKHFGTNHFNLRGRCFNYRKQTDHKGLSSNPKGFLDWHLCTSLAIIPVLLTSMAGQTFKNLSSSHAIKLERTSKHCGRVATPQQVNWQQILSGILLGSVFSILVFPIQCSSQTEMNSLKNLAGVEKKKPFSWTSLKITNMLHHRGLQLGIKHCCAFITEH